MPDKVILVGERVTSQSNVETVELHVSCESIDRKLRLIFKTQGHSYEFEVDPWSLWYWYGWQWEERVPSHWLYYTKKFYYHYRLKDKKQMIMFILWNDHDIEYFFSFKEFYDALSRFMWN